MQDRNHAARVYYLCKLHTIIQEHTAMKFLSTLRNKREKETAKPLHTFYLLTPSSNGSDSLSRLQRTRTTRTAEKRRDKKRFNFPQLASTLSNKIAKPAGQFVGGSGYFLWSRSYFVKWKSGHSQESEAWIAGWFSWWWWWSDSSVVGAIDKRDRGKTAVRSSCLLAMVRRKRRVLSYRLSGETPAGAYKVRRVSK